MGKEVDIGRTSTGRVFSCGRMLRYVPGETRPLEDGQRWTLETVHGSSWSVVCRDVDSRRGWVTRPETPFMVAGDRVGSVYDRGHGGQKGEVGAPVRNREGSCKDGVVFPPTVVFGPPLERLPSSPLVLLCQLLTISDVVDGVLVTV